MLISSTLVSANGEVIESQRTKVRVASVAKLYPCRPKSDAMLQPVRMPYFVLPSDIYSSTVRCCHCVNFECETRPLFS